MMSYPRSGTTWTQELVWLLANNLDYESAKSRLLTERFPFLEYVHYYILKIFTFILKSGFILKKQHDTSSRSDGGIRKN